MEYDDIIRIAFILLIASGFLLRGGRGATDAPEEGAERPVRPGPRSLAESGGRDPQPAQRNRTPTPTPVPARNSSTSTAGQSRSDSRRDQQRGRMDANVTREDALERGPSAGSMQTAEEIPQAVRRPRQTTVVPAANPAVKPGRIRQILKNEQSLQTAFVLQEVLGKPLGMRDRD